MWVVYGYVHFSCRYEKLYSEQHTHRLNLSKSQPPSLYTWSGSTLINRLHKSGGGGELNKVFSGWFRPKVKSLNLLCTTYTFLTEKVFRIPPIDIIVIPQFYIPSQELLTKFITLHRFQIKHYTRTFS